MPHCRTIAILCLLHASDFIIILLFICATKQRSRVVQGKIAEIPLCTDRTNSDEERKRHTHTRTQWDKKKSTKSAAEALSSLLIADARMWLIFMSFSLSASLSFSVFCYCFRLFVVVVACATSSLLAFVCLHTKSPPHFGCRSGCRSWITTTLCTTRGAICPLASATKCTYMRAEQSRCSREKSLCRCMFSLAAVCRGVSMSHVYKCSKRYYIRMNNE